MNRSDPNARKRNRIESTTRPTTFEAKVAAMRFRCCSGV
jgi:hypothetical protein